MKRAKSLDLAHAIQQSRDDCRISSGVRLDIGGNRRSRERYEPLGSAAGAVQLRAISLHLSVGAKRIERCVKNRSHCGVSRPLNAIVHPLALAPRAHDSRPAQIRQMPRYLGLDLTQDLHKVAHANFAPVHQIQEAQPCAVRKCGKEERDVDRFRISSHLVEYTP